jgi:glycolate oxidase iron-sulfur subunit
MDLGIDPDELATCVSCGLCLPHCPTYRVTGEEALSPRGRVAAMRQVQDAGAPPDASFVRSMETCVQCRGCETACPSGVPFGHLIEPARHALAEGPPAPPAAPDRRSNVSESDTNERQTAAGAAGREGRAGRRGRRGWRGRRAVSRPPLALRIGLRGLRWHRLVLAGSTVLAAAQRARLVPARVSRRLGLPARLPLRRLRLRATGDDVWLFTGCVMDAWMRDVHADALRVVTAAGAGVALPPPGASCCGALALHAGLGTEARALARRTIAALPGDAPILVDSAGCGAALKDYGHLLGTREAAAFSARVRDVHEWLAEHPPPVRATERPPVAVQDPCHLRHVQHAHAAVRTALSAVATVVELDDEGLCCGAGGAYAAAQPALAAAIRDRKLAAITRAGAPVVASANPGCALHLAAAGVEVVHPCTLLARAL